MPRIVELFRQAKYSVSQEGFTTSSYKLTVESGCFCYLNGHGEVGQFGESSHLAGKDY